MQEGEKEQGEVVGKDPEDGEEEQERHVRKGAGENEAVSQEKVLLMGEVLEILCQ